MAPGAADEAAATSLSTPHERVLAQAHGIAAADGLIPFAAWQAGQAGRAVAGQAWAWITPCHWRVGTGHVTMAHPQELQLDADESRALLAAMQPYFAEDGIRLEYEAPLLWLAQADIFAALPTASLDRVVGRVVDPWLPSGDAARPLRRLQQEMQMLLYTLPLNDARQRGGLLPVNSFWISGTGALPAGQPATAGQVQITHYLRDAALREDWEAWAKAWRELDARECARLAAQLDSGEPVRLTLCGERAARTWAARPANLLQRLGGLFAKPSPARLLEAL